LAETLRKKIVWAAAAAILFGFWPAKMLIEHHQHQAYAREAWAYFKKKCSTEAGEKIYKTFTGVKSVVVIKPLPPATEKDLYDQFWYGDPYSDASTYRRGESAAIRLVTDWKNRGGEGTNRGLDFVEIKSETNDEFVRIHRPASNDLRANMELVRHSISKFGIAWEDISTPEDRKYWVAGSRLQIIKLDDSSVVAERIGYMIEAGFGSKDAQRRPWQSSRGVGPNGRSCPDTYDPTDQWFVTSVFKQVDGN
jgi:hypothetical protein